MMLAACASFRQVPFLRTQSSADASCPAALLAFEAVQRSLFACPGILFVSGAAENLLLFGWAMWSSLRW